MKSEVDTFFFGDGIIKPGRCEYQVMKKYS